MGHRAGRSVAFKNLSLSGGNVSYVGDGLQGKTGRTGEAWFQSSCWQIMGDQTWQNLNLEELGVYGVPQASICRHRILSMQI